MTLELRLKGELTAPEKTKKDVAVSREQGWQDEEGTRGPGAWRGQQAELGARQGNRKLKRGKSCCGWQGAGHRAGASPGALEPRSSSQPTQKKTWWAQR